MAIIVNKRDLILQDTDPRMLKLSSDFVTVTPTTNTFITGATETTPSAITVRASLAGNLRGQSTKDVVAYLTNPTHDLLADVSGLVASGEYTTASTNFVIVESGLVSTGWTYYVSAISAGVSYKDADDISGRTGTGATSGVISALPLSIASLTADSAYVDITATKSGYTSITLRFNVTRISSAISPVLVNLTGTQSVVYDKNGLNPSTTSITFTATGKNVTGTYYYRFKVDGTVLGTVKSSSTGTATSDAYTVPANYFASPKNVTVEISANSDMSSILDTDTISLVSSRVDATSSSVSWTVTPAVPTTVFNNILILNSSSVPADTAVTITATVNMYGIDYSDSVVISNISESVVSSLNTSSVTISTAADGTGGVYTSATSTMTVEIGSTDNSSSWSYSWTVPVGVTASGASTRTITVTDIDVTVDNATLICTATRTGWPTQTKTFTISKSKAGTAGTLGVSPVVIEYTNDSLTVPQTSAGVSTWTGSGGLLQLYEGTTLLTLSSTTQSTSTPVTNGMYVIDITRISGNTLTEPTFSGTTTVTLNAWNGTLTTLTVYRITAYVRTSLGTSVTISSDITISPAKAGADGSPATAYWLTTSAPAIQKSMAGVYTPSSINYTLYSATGTNAPVLYSGRFIVATRIEGGVYINQYTSASNESSYSFIPPADVIAVRVRAYLAGGTTSLIDEEVSVVVSDGEIGASGVAAYLTNPTHDLLANSSGVVYATEYTSASTNFVIVEGGAQSTGWTYYVSAISAGVSYKDADDASARTGTGVTNGAITALPLSIASLTSDSAYVDITATKSGYTSITLRFSVTRISEAADGVSPVLVNLTGTQAIAYDKDGITPSPSTITFTATGKNVGTTTYYYRFKVDDVILGSVITNATGTVTSASYTAPTSFFSTPKTVLVEIATDLSMTNIVDTDTMSLVSSRVGASGASGVAAYLTNPTHDLLANSSGVVYATEYTSASTNFVIVEGGAQSTGWTYYVSAISAGVSYKDADDASARTGTGVTNGAITALPLSIASLTSDSAYVDITATKSGYTSITLRFSVTRISEAADGVSPVLVNLTGTQAIAYDKDGITPSPSTITFTATGKNVGTTTYYYRFKVDDVILGSVITNATGTVTSASYTAPTSFFSTPKTVLVEIATDLSMTNIVDTDTMSLVSSRVGATGAAGLMYAEISTYKWTTDTTPPTPPSGTGTYYWTNGTYTVPAGWSNSIPSNTVPGSILWKSTANIVATADTVSTEFTWDITPVTYISATNSNFGGNTSGTAAIPAGTQVGDTVFVFIGSDSGTGLTLPSDWSTIQFNTANTVGVRVAYKQMLQSVDSGISISGLSVASVAVARTYRGSIDFANIQNSIFTSSSTTSANPPLLDITTSQGIVIASAFIDDDNVTSVTAPAGYSNLSWTSAASAIGFSVLTADKLYTTPGIEDPAAFTTTFSDSLTAITLTVPQRPSVVSVSYIGSNGGPGPTGPTGNKTAPISLYQWSPTQPGNPSGQTTYTWDPPGNANYTGGNLWQTIVPANPGTPLLKLWFASKQITDVATATQTPVLWTSGFSVYAASENGSDGANGVKAAEAIVYQWALTIPTISGSSTYTWETDAVISPPTNWFTTISDTGSAGQTLWAAKVSLVDSVTVSTSTVNWATASIVPFGYSGSTGAVARIAYTATSSTLASAPSVYTTAGDNLPVFNSWNNTTVRAATTANITLSGLQTVDGISLIANDRVLVKNQTSSQNNGIYIASSSTWTRATDADTWTEFVGLKVYVLTGTTNATAFWESNSVAGGTLGTTAIAFTRAYYANVKAATTANIALSGPQTIDGVVLVAGDRVLVKNQTSSQTNGIYTVASGTWTRTADADTWNEFVGLKVYVLSGTIYTNSFWQSSAAAGGTLGTTAIAFTAISGASLIVWNTTVPTLAVGQQVWQADGMYNPTTNQTIWEVPYLSSLKVGNLSAISTNTGNLTVTGNFKTGTAAISGTTMSGSGGILYPNGNFAFGNSSSNVIYNGTSVFINGLATTSTSNITAPTDITSANFSNPFNVLTFSKRNGTTGILTVSCSLVFFTSFAGANTAIFNAYIKLTGNNGWISTVSQHQVRGVLAPSSATQKYLGVPMTFNFLFNTNDFGGGAAIADTITAGITYNASLYGSDGAFLTQDSSTWELLLISSNNSFYQPLLGS
jgi:hypothetical protein